MPTRLRLSAFLVLLVAASAAVVPVSASGSAPSGAPALTRWLASQIGPVATPAGAPPRAVRMHAAGEGAATLSGSASAAHPLRLVRSYLIPADDPSAARLANWSWTYDSAVTATAFTDAGDRAHAAVLLHQLGMLQGSGGSIATAFDVRTGESSGVVRSGTVAWVGLAAAAYDHRFRTSRYATVAMRAAAELRSLAGPDSLVEGGPDVSWISTEHNLLAYALLTRLAHDLRAVHPVSASRDAAAAAAIAGGLRSLVSTAGGAHFVEGLGDTVLPLDVQALGAMYLRSRHHAGLARQVVAFANARFAVSGRSIVKSPAAATYNETYAAAGPFSGYRPFVGGGTPNVLWCEGTAQMRAAEVAVGAPTAALDASMRAWKRITAGSGNAPLMADRTIDAGGYGEYHVWPAAAGAAWAVLAADGPRLFPAPVAAG
ncbi:MAG TPA: hypothetical protein VGI72_11125 [Gaiellales bacterium]